MGYQKINVVTGWVVFLISFIVYAITIEPTASFWDCGEFIACSYKLEVTHPPGAPLFMLIGRVFSLLAGGNLESVAYWISMVSVVSSAFAILFLFWSATHLVKRVLKIAKGEETTEQTLLIVGAGVVSALACTFSDSFWFSAVEAEVYGMSSFFTAFVFWAILKWENIEQEALANKWLILIAYVVGLSIGVHLLNLVAIPVLGLIIYFRKSSGVTKKGVLLTLLAASAIILIIMLGIIPGLPSLAGSLEIWLVNGIGLPFGSGVILFGLFVIGGLAYGLYYSQKKQKLTLNIILLSLTFIIVGYSSYIIIPIRSSYNPPIDENNPEDILSFVSYLKREQYGSRPLFHGQYYTAQVVDQKNGDPVYMKGENKYEIKDRKLEYVYDPKHTTILPRMYSSEESHKRRYREITGLKQDERPTFSDNLYFMFKHQLGHMYMRYFLWNFAGRASDIQDATWVGLNGAFDKLPSSLEHNKGRNIYFALPLLLGFLGIFVQYKRDQKYFWTTLLLFFLTGAALVLYLNSPPVEPRERDYIYAGSFYIFTIWIGLGVVALYDLLKSFIKNGKVVVVTSIMLGLVIPAVMARENWDDHDRSGRYFSVDSAKNYLESCAPNALLFTGGDNDTFPLWYAQEIEGIRTDVRVIVLSYFNTDWYISQMMRPAYKSEALPFSLPLKSYQQGGFNDYLPVVENPGIKGAINSRIFLDLIKKENPSLRIPLSNGSFYNSVPSKQLFMDVDVEKVKSLGVVPKGREDQITDRMVWNLTGRGLEKNGLAVLDLMVNSDWERPIYFNSTSLAGLGMDLRRYVIQEGAAYRLLPVENPNPQEYLVNTEVMYNNLMNKYAWRGLDNPKVYASEDYRNFSLNFRSVFNTLAHALVKEGDYEKAEEVIAKCLKVMPNESIPFDFFNTQQVGLLLEIASKRASTGDPSALGLANQIADVTSGASSEMLDYLLKSGSNDEIEIQRWLLSLNELARVYKAYGDAERASTYERLFSSYYAKIQRQ